MRVRSFLKTMANILCTTFSIRTRIGKRLVDQVLGARRPVLRRGDSRVLRFVAAATLSSVVFFSSNAFAQVPSGADVVAGQAAISQVGSTLNVNASTEQSIVNWDSFNVGAGSTANFNLPGLDSSILNRVTSANMPSTIAGTVNSNGHVILVNPSGIMVSASGMVNTNGFTASTFDITNQDFLSGALRFRENGSNSAVSNHGEIRTGAAGAQLIANQVVNNGLIESNGGNITLATGGTVKLENGVTYLQPGLETLASGISPTARFIQNNGTLRATGAATSGGEIYLVNPNGSILHDGTIAAQNRANADGQTVGGKVRLEAIDITLGENASIDVSGQLGGGEALVGGDWQGRGDMLQATTVTMEAGAQIDASAMESGDGGKIVLWSDITNRDSLTRVGGTLLAMAGRLFGDGGAIETSGGAIETTGVFVNAGAAFGRAGLWLIDPFNYVIDSSAATDIQNSLNSGTSVTVSTAVNNGAQGSSGDSSGLGDITVASAITKTGGGDATLTLAAANSIIVDAAISSTSGQLSVILDADNNAGVGDGGGIVILSNNIDTNGGDLRFGTDRTASIGGLTTKVGGDVYVASTSTLTTSGGNVEVSGETIIGAAGGLSINSGGGDIAFDGVLNSGNSYSYHDGPDGSGSWEQAVTNAQNGTGGGAAVGDSYLVAIQSRLENAIASSVTIDNGSYRGAWIGIYRDRNNTYGEGDNIWRYVGGPNANQSFFSQDGNSSNDSYNNFGSGEPNGTGTGGEYAGQFFGNQALWNDLTGSRTYAGDMSSVYNVMGYVRETNLANSPLTIDAGGGGVTFGGNVGVSKSLSNLSLSNIGSFTAGGSLNLSGNLSITAASGLSPAVNQSDDWIVAGTSLFGLEGGNLSLNRSGNDFGGLVTIASAGIATLNDVNTLNLGNVSTTGDFYGQGDKLSADGTIQTINQSITLNARATSADAMDLASSSNLTLDAGSGDISLIADAITFGGGGLVTDVNTTGVLSIAPNGGGFTDVATTLGWSGTISGADWTATDPDVADLVISNFANLGGLTIGKIGMTTSVQIDSAIEINGPIDLLANNVTLNANLDSTSSGSGGVITINAEGDLVQANGVEVSTDGGDLTYWSAGALDIDGALSAGTGDISLTGNSLNLGDTVTASGSLTIGVESAGTSIGVGTGSGIFEISSAELAMLQSGFSSVTIGGANAGDLQVGGITAFDTATTFEAGSGADLSVVSGGLSWASDDAVTLAAGDNIFINGDIAIGGSGATLNLFYGGTDGSSAPAAGMNFYLDIEANRTIDFSDTSASLKIGNEDFTLVDSSMALQGMAANGRYAIAEDFSLAGTTHTGSFYSTEFSGKLEGLGHELDGLTIRANGGGNFGLFDQLNNASIRHLGVTEMDLLGQSTSQAAANDLRIGGIAGNVSGSGTTVLDGVWTSGVIATKQGSLQDVFYAGGLVGGHDSGTLEISRSFSTANVSSEGSDSGKMSVGGLLGDSGDFNGVSSSGGAAIHLSIDQSYAIGSIVEGTYAGYYGSGGLVGVVYGDSGTITDSFSHSNVVGGVSSGGIVGYTVGTTTKNYDRLYTTMDRFGNNYTPTNSYTINTLDAATNNGTQLPTGWSSATWNIGLLPSLTAVGKPAELLYVQITGGTGTFGDLAAPTYQIVDRGGAAVTFGSGNYSNLDGVTGTGRFTLGQYANAGTYNAVSYLSGLSLTGDDASLFTLNPFTTPGTYTINTRTLTVSLSNVGVTKIYDGTTSAPSGFVPVFSINNFASGDTGATLGYASALYNDARVADADTLTLGGLSISNITGINGSLASDYSLNTTSLSVAAAISVKPLVVSGILVSDKIYDGNTSATIDTSGMSLSGIVTGDDVDLTSLTASFTDRNVGTDKVVSLANPVFTGADASNYSIAPQTSATADITARSVLVSGITASNRIYDGTTSAVVDTSGITFSGLVAGDDLTAMGITGLFDDKNVGNGKTVTLSGATYGGADVGNYSITSQASTTANISPRSITVSGITASNRIYDGTMSALLDHSGVLFNGMIAGDDLSASGTTGTFADKNVGVAKTVSLNGTSYSGLDVGNYNITDQTSTTANITARSITVSGITASNRIYDGTTTALVDMSGVTFSGIIAGDDLSASGTIGAFGDKNVGVGKTVTLSGTTYGGADVGNYSIANQTSTTANISARSILVSGIAASNRIYDGSTSALVDLSGVVFSGLVAGDDLSASGTTGTFGDKHVGIGKTVALNGTTYLGADVGNYSITDQVSTTANITAKAIIVSGLSASDRIYDGTTSALIDHSGVVFNGLVAGDDVSAFGTSGAFADKNVGSSKTVALSGTNYGGLDVGNYSFTDQAFATASISPRSIMVSGISVSDRIYDGTTTAIADLSGVVFSGLVAGDDVNATGTEGLFADKNVGSSKAVLLSGTVYGGADVGNYTIADQTLTTASITPRAISIGGITVSDKVYDGTTNAQVDMSGLTFVGMIAGDDLTAMGTSGAFSDKNVGAGKTVLLAGTTYGGTDLGNYLVADQDLATATILRLNTVAWIGGTTGSWSDPANWTGGAIPDLANVENVIIPVGSTPVFDSSVVGPVELESLSGGSLTFSEGDLNVAQNATLENLTQNGGSIDVGSDFAAGRWMQNGGTSEIGGDLSVLEGFSQGGLGVIDVSGSAQIANSAGTLTVNDLTAEGIQLNNPQGDILLNKVVSGDGLTVAASGEVGQSNGGQLAIDGETNITSGTKISLTNSNNQFSGTVFADAPTINVRSGEPFLLTKQGASLDQEMEEAVAQTVNDSFVRPAETATQENSVLTGMVDGGAQPLNGAILGGNDSGFSGSDGAFDISLEFEMEKGDVFLIERKKK